MIISFKNLNIIDIMGRNIYKLNFIKIPNSRADLIIIVMVKTHTVQIGAKQRELKKRFLTMFCSLLCVKSENV